MENSEHPIGESDGQESVTLPPQIRFVITEKVLCRKSAAGVAALPVVLRGRKGARRDSKAPQRCYSSGKLTAIYYGR
jgi:hypothetical protein